MLITLLAAIATAAPCNTGAGCFQAGQDLRIRALIDPPVVEREVALRCPTQMPEARYTLGSLMVPGMEARRAELFDLLVATAAEDSQLPRFVVDQCQEGHLLACQAVATSALFAGDAADFRQTLLDDSRAACAGRRSLMRRPHACKVAALLAQPRPSPVADVLLEARSRGQARLDLVTKEIRERVAAATLDCGALPLFKFDGLGWFLYRHLSNAGQAALERGCELGSKDACDTVTLMLVLDEGGECQTAKVCHLAGNAVKRGTEINEAMGMGWLRRGCELGEAQSCVDLLLLIKELGLGPKAATEPWVTPKTVSRWKVTPAATLLEELCDGMLRPACLGLLVRAAGDVAALSRMKEAVGRRCPPAKYCPTLATLLAAECRAGLTQSCAKRLSALEGGCHGGSLEACKDLLDASFAGELDAAAFARLRAMAEEQCPKEKRCLMGDAGVPAKTATPVGPPVPHGPGSGSGLDDEKGPLPCGSAATGTFGAGPYGRSLGQRAASLEQRRCELYAATRDPRPVDAAMRAEEERRDAQREALLHALGY